MQDDIVQNNQPEQTPQTAPEVPAQNHPPQSPAEPVNTEAVEPVQDHTPIEETPSIDAEQSHDQVPDPEPKPEGKRAPLPVIFMAIAICLALVGVAVYIALNQTDSKSSSKINKVNVPQTQSTTTPAADTTKDEVKQAVTESGQLPTSTVDPSTGITDQSLGLQ